MPQIQPHALVVGGTGMLKAVVLDLAKQGYRVSVVARHDETLKVLVEEAAEYAGVIDPIALDWHNLGELTTALEQSVRDHGPFSLAVVWIHSTAPEAPIAVAQLIQGDFFHVRSSSVGDPNYKDPVDVKKISELTNISYHDIILGSISHGHERRWLSNDEISSGVIEAIKAKQKRFIVGEL